jgi:outer membrane protein assembly factor BamB
MSLRTRFGRIVVATIVASASVISSFAVANIAAAAADPMDWPNWRGPTQNRVSKETGIVDKFDLESGENVLWKCPEAAGISSPIVMNGKVYTQVRHKPDTKEEEEEVICMDANTGKILWENKWNVYLSDVPAERVGWSSVVGDPASGNIYSLGVNGNFSCINGETGKTIWSRSLGEEFGMISPYGGRTHPPALFEDLVIINAVMVGWGDTARPAHRILALDKKTGETRWFTHTKELPEDTIFSTPTFTVIDGQQLMIVGSADGSVWAFQPRTGKTVWTYKMSRRGLNVSPLVVGDKVFMTQAEENPDNRTQGMLSCFNAHGEGDITKTNEAWHLSGVMSGKSSPILVDDRIYTCDDAGNLYIVDAKTGKQIGNKPIKLLGTIVRASPLSADGKIYLTSTTGWHVLQPTPTGVKFLAKNRLPEADEVSGSMAISHGKIYLPTGAALYCIGKKDAKPALSDKKTDEPAPEKEKPVAAGDAPAWIELTPGEMLLKPSEKQKVTARVFNDRGQELTGVDKSAIKFALNGPGAIDKQGVYTAPNGVAHTATTVNATLDKAKGEARLRVVPPLPWKFDFNDITLAPVPTNPAAPKEGEPPVTWIGARYRNKVREKDGEKVMVKVTTIPKGTRSQSWFGPPDMHDYTIQADLMGQQRKQPATTPVATASKAPAASTDAPPPAEDTPVLGMPDIGLVAQRYTMDMMGNHQQLQLRSWPPQVARRFSKTIPFAWQADKWYTMKFSVSNEGGKAVLRGKVWLRGEKEPEKWTIEATDDTPNTQGSPGLFGQSTTAEAYYDNVLVTANDAKPAATAKK